MIGTGIPYKLYQDNRETSKFRGQWYARVKAFGTVDLDGLADHIASHGSTFTKADIAGVLYAMQDCILELLLSGHCTKKASNGRITYMSSVTV